MLFLLRQVPVAKEMAEAEAYEEDQLTFSSGGW